jgi:hypothetical protein
LNRSPFLPIPVGGKGQDGVSSGFQGFIKPLFGEC